MCVCVFEVMRGENLKKKKKKKKEEEGNQYEQQQKILIYNSVHLGLKMRRPVVIVRDCRVHVPFVR